MTRPGCLGRVREEQVVSRQRLVWLRLIGLSAADSNCVTSMSSVYSVPSLAELAGGFDVGVQAFAEHIAYAVLRGH